MTDTTIPGNSTEDGLEMKPPEGFLIAEGFDAAGVQETLNSYFSALDSRIRRGFEEHRAVEIILPLSGALPLFELFLQRTELTPVEINSLHIRTASKDTEKNYIISNEINGNSTTENPLILVVDEIADSLEALRKISLCVDGTMHEQSTILEDRQHDDEYFLTIQEKHNIEIFAIFKKASTDDKRYKGHVTANIKQVKKQDPWVHTVLMDSDSFNPEITALERTCSVMLIPDTEFIGPIDLNSYGEFLLANQFAELKGNRMLYNCLLLLDNAMTSLPRKTAAAHQFIKTTVNHFVSSFDTHVTQEP